MNFVDTPEEARFRKSVRDWLDSLPRSERGGCTQQQRADAARAWQRTLHDVGWAGISWPVEYGGLGGTSVQQLIFEQEARDCDLFSDLLFVGAQLAGPTIMVHGTDGQKRRYLDPILTGQEIWCQLFSEPGAGSDLAGLQTRAVRDQAHWVVNGQKVWTSGAQYANWGILLARTDPDQPKHRGITYFLLDMHTPGIDVRPIKQINGESHFNETFLTDVRIPADCVLGGINGGWAVVHTTLALERTSMGGAVLPGASVEGLIQLASEYGVGNKPVIRQQLAAAYTRARILDYLGYRVQTALSSGKPVGPESSVIKLFLADHLRTMTNLALDIQGARALLYGQATPGDHDDWVHAWLTAPSVRIAGGTDEIQRSTIGERILGLPPEPRLDKTVAFRNIPKAGGV